MVQQKVCSESTSNNSFNSISSSHNCKNSRNPESREDDETNLARNKFSLFKWFKRQNGNNNNVNDTTLRKDVDNVNRSIDSFDTYYSTVTVKSFAFQSGFKAQENDYSLQVLKQAAKVGPFAPGATKIPTDKKINTLPSNYLKKDLTTRYSLQPDRLTTFSCGNLVSEPETKFVGSLPGLEEKRNLDPENNNVVGVFKINQETGNFDKQEEEKNRRLLKVPGKQLKTKKENSSAKEIEGSVKSEKLETGSGRNSKIFLGKNDEIEVPKLRKVHVKGKRKAPDPPGTNLKLNVEEKKVGTSSVKRRKRRPAPAPPVSRGMDRRENLSNDTLILQKGVLFPRKESQQTCKPSAGRSEDSSPESSRSQTSTIAMPRPWYKRSIFEHQGTSSKKGGEFLRNSQQIKDEPTSSSKLRTTEFFRNSYQPKDEFISSTSSSSSSQGMNTLSKFFSREGRHLEDKKREIKRKSGVSILMNISELDKEAAAIVREEQNRTREFVLLKNSASLGEPSKEGNEELIQDILSSSIENSPKRGTRALISKFNAIGNKTKTTLNTNFFVNKSKEEPLENWKRSPQSYKNKDISKYFLPHQKATDKEAKGSPKFDRITFLQNQLDFNRKSESAKSSNSSLFFDEIITPRKENFSKTELERNKLKEFSKTVNELPKSSTKILEEINRPSTSSHISPVSENSVTREIAKTGNKCPSSENPAAASNSDAKLTADRQIVNEKSENEIKDPRNTSENLPVVDLKEMLKEMKHSLPKRPKSKKRVDENSTKLEPTTQLEYPLIIKTQPIVFHGFPEKEKQKVSSSCQTSANIRKVKVNEVLDEKPSTSFTKCMNDGGKKDPENRLGKNYAFQLIRPRDFAEIEAIKTTKRSECNENTYANITEGSIYANAIIIPSKAANRIPSPNFSKSRENVGWKDNVLKKDPPSSPNFALNFKQMQNFSDDKKGAALSEEEDEESVRQQNVNTLAVNRLLRKLEAAIASGNHRKAAGLAEELARLKINCSVVRQRSKMKDLVINVNMYIEDKLAHQGPIPLQVPVKMTVAELKTKIYHEFEIPTNIQRWIIGKNLADHEESTLQELQAAEGSPVFLYLVVPEVQQEDTPNEKTTPDEVKLDEKLAKTEKSIASLENPQPRPEEVQLLQEADPKEQVEIEKNNKVEIKQNDEANEGEVSEKIKMQRYEELISLENCDVIPNSEPVECPICFVTYEAKEGVILRDCLHMFCRPCLANTITYCDEAEVKCPYRDSEYTCESTLQEREIKALVEPEIYQQHLAKSIMQAENNAGDNAFHCKTPDCPGWCIYDDNVNNFLCPVCGFNNCLTCQVVHTGKNCRQYQEELRFSKETDQESKRTAAMLEEMVDRGEALACPTCAVVLMKKWGCDWLRCSMCKTEICWVTRGPRWGPGGKGDTSGGCRCGENGVKCHPQCNYCH